MIRPRGETTSSLTALTGSVRINPWDSPLSSTTGVPPAVISTSRSVTSRVALYGGDENRSRSTWTGDRFRRLLLEEFGGRLTHLDVKNLKNR